MAEINTGGKKVSTRIDLTPMVDLGFLLVTFFMVTTTFSKPNVMELAMPDKNNLKKDEQAVKESRAITLILGEKDRVYYYHGTGQDPANTKVETAYFTSGSNGIRKVLLDQKATVANNTSLQIKEREPIVLIKPDSKSRYKNVVDILDEMKICDIKIYAIVDISVPEKEMIKNIVVTE
jgi:biopolymer transport protein ExbD